MLLALRTGAVCAVLSAFDVDYERGFLPVSDPDVSAAGITAEHPFYTWKCTAADLTAHLQACNVRTWLNRMTHVTVSEQQLQALPLGEVRHALLLLSLMAHSYIWGETPVVDAIPANIAQPWCTVAAFLGVPPIVSHASLVLNNWKRLVSERCSTVRAICCVCT